MDWGEGRYELTADRLLPVAERAVAALAPRPGERVLDVACGTGNAALLAARAGASVHGVDLAPRLVEVARARAAADALDATFTVGDATALAFADAAFDATMSVFGVIFADAQTAARELLRVTRPGGRIVVTTWTTGGPTPKVMRVAMEALGTPPKPPTWSDPEVLRSVFAPHDVELVEDGVPFVAESAAAYVREHVEHHPLWVGMEPALRATGRFDEVVAEAERIFAEANEDPAAFRTTSGYWVATVRVR